MTLIAAILVLTTLTGSAALAAVTDQGAAGAELIGTQALGWEGAEWLSPEPLRLEDLRGKVVLVRWWTDRCPYCSRSAPALNEFHARYARRGLIVIGMYHPKPMDRPITASEIREAARERGFGFPIAIDRNWSVLRHWWLDGGPRSATSVSFLIDQRGVIRYIHPGPAFHREVVRGDARPRRDFGELESIIETLLADPNQQAAEFLGFKEPSQSRDAMGVQVYKHFFDTREQVLDDLKKTGFWPTTFVSEPSPPLDVHWHNLEVHGYVVEGRTWFLDAKGDIRHDVAFGDKIVIPARTLHAEGENSENVIYIIALPEPGPFDPFLEQLAPADLTKK